MKLAVRIVELMREGKRGEVWQHRQIAKLLEVSLRDVTEAVHSLRRTGRVDWNKLRLTPSMWPDEDDQAFDAEAVLAESASAGDRVASPPSPAPIQTADPQPAVAPAEVAGTASEVRQSATADAGAPATEARRQTILDQVRAEAEALGVRRAAARSTGTIHSATALSGDAPGIKILQGGRPVIDGQRVEPRARITPLSALELGSLTFVEGLQTLFLDTPDDLIRTLNRRHAAMWRRCLALGRERDERPAEILFHAIECGLAAIDAQHPERKTA